MFNYHDLGFLGVVVNQGLFTVGLNYTTSNHSAVLIAIGPIIILLLGQFSVLWPALRAASIPPALATRGG